MSSLIHHFEQYALISREKQDDLFRLLGEHTMELDIDAGTARFSSGLEVPFQALGTESDNSLTWLWAWAEEQTELPDHLLRSARELKAWGARNAVAEFTLPSVDLNRADGNMLSLIASVVCKASGYYRDPYDGGTLFILLSGVEPERRTGLDRAGLIRHVEDLISRYDFDHRNALLAYFRGRNLPAIESGDTINAELETGERIVAECDAAGRIKTVNGEALTW